MRLVNQTNAGRALLIASLALMNLSVSAQPAPVPAAHWEGEIQAPEKDVPISVDLAKNSKGEWAGSASIPNLGVTDAPLVELSVKGQVVHFGMGLAHDSFDGKLSEDGNSLAGTATSDQGSAPFRLRRSGEANVKIPPPSTPLSKEFVGAWEGTLNVSGQSLRAALRLTNTAAGSAAGTLTSVDQGGQEFPITTITQKDNQLRFEIQMIRGKYAGTLDANANEIAGEYTIDGLNLPLVFRRPAAGSREAR